MLEVMEVPEKVKEPITKIIRSKHELLGQENKKGQIYTDVNDIFIIQNKNQFSLRVVRLSKKLLGVVVLVPLLHIQSHHRVKQLH